MNHLQIESEASFKEKGSKFIGYAIPVSSIEEIETALAKIKSIHPTSRHLCYAYRIGTGNDEKYRYNDDGEPSNSAGKPIYGQLLSFNLTNTLVGVIRYFGGTKLGVGGLVRAYKEAARLCLSENKISEYVPQTLMNCSFSYSLLGNVMKILKQNDVSITFKDINNQCSLTFTTAVDNENKIKNLLTGIGATIT